MQKQNRFLSAIQPKATNLLISQSKD